MCQKWQALLDYYECCKANQLATGRKPAWHFYKRMGMLLASKPRVEVTHMTTPLRAARLSK